MNLLNFILNVSFYVAIIFTVNIKLSYCDPDMPVYIPLPYINNVLNEGDETTTFNMIKIKYSNWKNWAESYRIYLAKNFKPNEDIDYEKILYEYRFRKTIINFNSLDVFISYLPTPSYTKYNQIVLSWLPKEYESCLDYLNRINVFMDKAIHFVADGIKPIDEMDNAIYEIKTHEERISDAIKYLHQRLGMLQVNCSDTKNFYNISSLEWYPFLTKDIPIKNETYKSYILRCIALGRIPLPENLLAPVNHVHSYTYFKQDLELLEDSRNEIFLLYLIFMGSYHEFLFTTDYIANFDYNGVHTNPLFLYYK